MVQRKKERVAKMKINNEMQETIKKESDPIYMEVSNMYEEQSKKETIAKSDISRNIANQKSNLKMRLA